MAPRSALVEDDLDDTYALFLQYLLGEEKNTGEAMRLLHAAANGGHPEAQVQLGGCYLDGHVVEKDEVEAARLFRQSSEAGNPKALASLGYLYKLGIGGLEQDDVEAERLWLLALRHEDDAQTQMNLGQLYETGGKGVAQDLPEALRRYRLALRLPLDLHTAAEKQALTNAVDRVTAKLKKLKVDGAADRAKVNEALASPPEGMVDALAEVMSRVTTAKDKAACAAVSRAWAAASRVPLAWREVVVRSKKLTDEGLASMIARAGNQLSTVRVCHADMLTSFPALPPTVTRLQVSHCKAIRDSDVVAATSAIPEGGLEYVCIDHNAPPDPHEKYSLTVQEITDLRRRVNGGFVFCSRAEFGGCDKYMDDKHARFVQCFRCWSRSGFLMASGLGQFPHTCVCRSCAIRMMHDQGAFEPPNGHRVFRAMMDAGRHDVPFKCSNCVKWENDFPFMRDEEFGGVMW